MRPLDPRLLRHARAARPYVVLTAAVGTLTAAAVVGQAAVVAHVVAEAAGSQGRGTITRTVPWLVGFGALVGVRTLLTWVQERFGHRAVTAVTGQLRAAVLAKVVADRPFSTTSDGTAEVTTLLTRGLDGLDGYLTKYLPQLLLVSTVTPVVLAVIWWNDTIAGITVLLTLPLVPLMMAVVGLSTQAASQRRLGTLQQLGAQVLDLIAGLPTLRAHGRESFQGRQVRAIGDAHRQATMRTLASAFLSSLVLETMTTLSVALVAVGVGLRLVNGSLDLRTGLLVLILAPEAFLPLRMLGVHYHASADGLAACAQAFAVLEAPAPIRGRQAAPDLRGTTVRLADVRVEQPGGTCAPDGASGVIAPGRVTALVGASGSGKSTLLAALLGLRPVSSGRIVLEPASAAPVALSDVDPHSVWAQVAWVPQQPSLVPGTVLDNVLLGCDEFDPSVLTAAAVRTGLATVVAGLPHGWQTTVGTGGVGLSAGQRQRLAVTRALLRDASLVLLDEPTAHLDAEAEAAMHAGLAALRSEGRTVVVVAHRPSLVALADDVIEIRAHAAEMHTHDPSNALESVHSDSMSTGVVAA
ncbi:thiol reductant ABC exporter subunit CydD [Spongisporangium articulatum]|uniref:Thiol reductant ABC exporter subunit CydD n=1 Tax=Spongisporangium articulatum TaxID=3362603 RepID=A0ABW8AHJ2_9ACTN